MKTLKLYWLRFKSKTPKALQKLQLFLGALLVPIGSAYAVVEETSKLHGVFLNAMIVIPFMVMVLQFATSDPKVQDLTKDNV